MSRLLDKNLEIFKQGIVSPVLCYEFDFKTGAVRLSTHYRHIQLRNNKNILVDFYGIGEAFNSQNKNRSIIGEISPIVEPSGGEVSGQTVKLSGIPNSVVDVALGQDYTNRICNIYLGFADAGGNVNYMQQISVMLIETMSIEVGKNVANVEVSLKSRMYNWNKPITRKSTNADQQARYPNDLSHSLVNFTATNRPWWGGE